MKNVGKKIKLLRQQKEWTQENASKQLGISIPAFSKIETGVTDINLSRLEQVAKLFDMSVVELLSFNEDESPANVSAIEALNQKISERDAEIFNLQKKLIELHEAINKN